MSASGIWTVHCSECNRWDTMHETRGEAERNARLNGWLVEPRSRGGINLCPDCRVEADR